MDSRFSIWIPMLLFLLLNASSCMASADNADADALSPQQFKAMLDGHQMNSDVVLLDVRTAKEFKAGHIHGAVLLDYHSRDFVERLKKLDRDKTYLIYCRSGNRSGKSLAIFEKLGFHRAYHLSTGVNGWSREKYPLVH